MSDVVLLLGFGGPERPAEIRPFIERVLAGRPVPPERIEAVVAHYELMGGSSPYNELTRRQAQALERELRAGGDETPIEIAYRCSDPDNEAVLARLAQRGVTRAFGIILAPHPAAWGPYQASVDRARAAIGPSAPIVDYAEPYYLDPAFIGAHAERINDAIATLESSFDQAELIFTAHSIPVAGADAYVAQVAQTATRVAESVGAPRWRIAYQSRSGSPREPWLEPDIRDAIGDCARAGIHDIVVSPIGFLCDHVEVLYDLDVDAKAAADSLKVRMARAVALNDHPLFVRALAHLKR
jgi:ferrochelatase